MTRTPVLTVDVEREVAADAHGVALLLGGTSAADFWPGLVRVDPVPVPRSPLSRGARRRASSGVLVSAVLPAPVSGEPAVTPVATTLLLRARPPRREPGGTFTLELSLVEPVGGGDTPVLQGQLRVIPVGGPGVLRTRAELRLTWTLPPAVAAGGEAIAPHWRGAAERFVANLATAAESRAAAA